MSQTTCIDKSSPIPLYYQLKQLLLSDIESGKYPKGSPIPTEKDFSNMYQLSRTTIRQALTELVQEGWLTRQKGKGTFVTNTRIQQDFLNRIESFSAQILRLGMTPSTEVLTFDVIQADLDIAEHLDLSEGDKVIYLYRVRRADGDPIVSVKTYLPYTLCSFVLEHDLEAEALYDVLSLSSVTKINHIDRTIEAVEADHTDERVLNLSFGKPIQAALTVAYNTDNVPIEYSLARYRGDRNKFQVKILPYTG